MKQLVWVFLFFTTHIYAQINITGKLVDYSNRPVVGVSVVINKVGTEHIIAFDITDKEGRYGITLSTNEEKVDIVIRGMGYEIITKTIENRTQSLNFTLQPKAVELKDIIVKGAPITQKGDTINYSVNSFAKAQDRTIADVLKRMPGIEVLSDGKILYQGKPINKYYIEGLDLLEGKYDLANKNLPHKEVSKVQILENHQPIKLLDSLQFSDKAALNIKLKKPYTFTGQAELGTGASPLLWDANITPMLFSKKRQLLLSYQSNNIGDNVGKQLKTLTIEDLLEQFENNPQKQDWLSVQLLNPPNFSEKRWLNNNINLLSANYLQKLKKDYELKFNVAYLNDYQQQSGYTNTLFYTPSDSILLQEKQYNQLYHNSLDGDMVLLRNSKNNYLKNTLQFQGFWDGQRGNIERNHSEVTQNLQNHYFKVSNQLKTIFPLGKQLVNLNSYLGINQTPQTLQVKPGVFNELLNNGMKYSEVFQEVNLNTIYTNNSIGFTKGWKAMSFEPKVGFALEKQRLNSDLWTSENRNLGSEFQNHLDWLHSKFYFDLSMQYKKDKWRVSFKTPINQYFYQLNDKPLSQNQNVNRITFEPRLSIIYDANAFWKFNTSIDFKNNFGTINQVYYAYILNNYRNINRINAHLPQSSIQNMAAGISYRNPIKSLFFNVLFSSNKEQNNLLYKTQIESNGATVLQAIERQNKRSGYKVSTRLSKYYSKLKTNISFRGNYGLQKSQQIINNVLSTILNQNWEIGTDIETDITDWFNCEYKGRFAFSKNKIQTNNNPTIQQQNHSLNFNFYPKELHYFSIKSEYIKNNVYSNNRANLFADFVYRYTWKKKNIDLEIQLNNMFNTKNYRTVTVDSFNYVESNFTLRPRQILFKFRFSL